MTHKIVKKTTVHHRPYRLVPVKNGSAPHDKAQEAHSLDDVHKQVDQILAQARQEADLIRKQAYDDGFKAGQEAALEQKNQAIADIEKKAEKKVWDTLHSIEPDVVKLALSIVERVCRIEASHSKDVAIGAIREGLRDIGHQKSILIKLNPTDVDAVQSRLAELAPHDGIQRDIQLKAEEEIEKGGCVIEADHLTIDATLQTRISEASKAIERAA